MTHDKMFEEIGCPKELKKCQAELKRQKKFIENQLRVYSNHAIGLGKMFQQTDMRKVYRKVEVVL